MASIIYIIGLLVTIIAIFDISKKAIPTSGKVMFSIILVITSWIGIIVYYLFVRNRITNWFRRNNVEPHFVQETTEKSSLVHNQEGDIPHYIKIDE